jgi:hypothetical protein
VPYGGTTAVAVCRERVSGSRILGGGGRPPEDSFRAHGEAASGDHGARNEAGSRRGLATPGATPRATRTSRRSSCSRRLSAPPWTCSNRQSAVRSIASSPRSRRGHHRATALRGGPKSGGPGGRPAEPRPRDDAEVERRLAGGEGDVSALTHVMNGPTRPAVTVLPRNPYRSTSRVRAPLRAAAIAAPMPAGPPPMASTSVRRVTGTGRESAMSLHSAVALAERG